MENARSDADRRFRAFVQGGDPRDLGFVYDLLAPELLRIALHTTRDAAEAEDVLQATFVTAIERAARFDPKERVMPWLVGILANEARKARASAARRPDPARIDELQGERQGRRQGERPEVDAERAELLARLETALERVPIAFRPVLQLRLRHGLSVPEIAAALGRPSGTVRSQLARGTEFLRRALPAGLAGALALVAAPTRGLASVREAVLEAAAIHAPLAGTTTAATVLGGIAVKKLVAVAAVLAAGIVLWTITGTSREPTAAIADARASELLAAPEAPRSEEPRAALALSAETQPAREAAAAERVAAVQEELRPALAAAERGGTLVVHAHWPDGTRAAGEIVLAQPPIGRFEETLARATGDDGAARFEGLDPGPWNVRLLRGRENQALVHDGRTSELRLELIAGVAVDGRVVDLDGVPVAGADVWLSERYMNNRGHVLATTGASGAFTLRCISPDHWIGARKAGFAPSSLRAVRGEDGARVALELRLEQRGASAGGRVIDARGEPIEDALVLIGAEMPASLRIDDGSFVPDAPPQRARSGADGRFELATLAPGLQPLQARARGFAPFASEVELFADAPNEITVMLVPEARVVGRVLGEDGEPLMNAWVHTQPAGTFASATAYSQSDGRFELTGLNGSVVLVAQHPHYGRAELKLELAPGDVHECELALRSTPRIEGRVLDARGAPLEGVVVVALPPDEREGMRSQVTVADGSFAINDLVQRDYTLRLQRKNGWREFPLIEVEGVWPGGAPLVLRVPDAREAGRITAEVRAPDGAAVSGAELQVWHEERRIWRTFVSGERGSIEAEYVPAGTLVLDLRHVEHPWKHLGVHKIEAGATLDLGTLVFDAAGELRAELRGLSDERIATLRAALSSGVRESGVARISGRELVAGPLAPGEHLLVVGADGVQQVRRSFRIEAGVRTELELQLEACAIREVLFTLEAGAPKPSWIACSLLDSAGELVWGGNADCDLEVPLARVSALPGSYRLIAGGPRGIRGEAELEVQALGASLPPITVPLR